VTVGSAEIDPARFRAVLGHFCTGVTVVTTHDGVAPAGFACQSFAALSLDPPLVLFCPARSSGTWPVIERVGRFAVNVLAEHQYEVSAAFGAPGADKFASVCWRRGVSGSPLLEGALTWVECNLHATLEAGDHYVVVGRVIALGDPSGGRPLLFYQGRYTGAEVPRAAAGDLLTWVRQNEWL
jgi:3-hydroxy-9,10-secoandrosta-1,3,5(10)-triene-9,17-dione monooxygenase reductase component